MSHDDPLANVRIVLCAPAEPGNVGAAARAMKTMGVHELALVRPARFPDPRARRLAAAAADVLARARVCESLDAALEGVAFAVACSARSREIAVERCTMREAAARLVAVARTQPAALVFGNERTGLTNAEVNRCRLLAAIPAAPAYPSLNLAAAVQVACYELRLAALGEAGAGGTRARTLATHEALEAFYAELERSLVATGFLDPARPGKLMPRLRRLFARAALDPVEINLLRGILKAFVRGRCPAGKLPTLGKRRENNS